LRGAGPPTRATSLAAGYNEIAARACDLEGLYWGSDARCALRPIDDVAAAVDELCAFVAQRRAAPPSAPPGAPPGALPWIVRAAAGGDIIMTNDRDRRDGELAEKLIVLSIVAGAAGRRVPAEPPGAPPDSRSDVPRRLPRSPCEYASGGVESDGAHLLREVFRRLGLRPRSPKGRPAVGGSRFAVDHYVRWAGKPSWFAALARRGLPGARRAVKMIVAEARARA
jgi:hypothetical protein